MIGYALIFSSFAAIGATQSTLISSVNSLVPESTPSATAAGASATEPCALAAQYQTESKRSLGPITAEVAYSCLMSVPVDKENDLQLIEDLKLLLQWNTDTQRFKDLPDWYDNESFDLYGELDAIKRGIENGTYESDFAVQTSITNLFSQTGDGHVSWAADISKIFSWQSGVRLVSVSSDGQDKPEIYSYGDLSLLYYNVYNFTPSPITKIDGEEIQSYLKRLGKQLAYHDSHARYNQMFPQQAQTSLGQGEILGTYANGVYHGPNNTYTFQNGTVKTVQNIALVNGNLTGVDSGKAFLTKLLSGDMTRKTPTAPSNTTQMTSATSSPTSTPKSAPGYPQPEKLHPSYAIGGYYLNGSEFRDVAVLSIPTFEPAEYDDAEFKNQPTFDFQAVAREFIAQAAADGKKKMVIDLRANGGGSTFLGFDLFKLFFPQTEPYQSNRRRAHQAYKQLVDLVTYLGDTVTAEGKDMTDPDVGAGFSEFYYKYFSVTPNDTDFASPAAFYGPHMNANDNFTSLRAWNLSTTAGLASNASIAGYGGPLAVATAPFNASNIILLQDGACASTCAIFSELMRTMQGVETLAIGGLPNDDIPMQKVGGTKGWLTWNLSSFRTFSSRAYTLANDTTIESWAETELEAMNETSVIYDRGANFQVNAADAIRRGDTSETPLQFVYEAAECRIWYTPQMIFNVSQVWEAAARTKWGGGQCNAGPGWGKSDSVSGSGSGNKTPGTGAAGRVGISTLALMISVAAMIFMV